MPTSTIDRAGDEPEAAEAGHILDPNLPTFADLLQAAADTFPEQLAFIHAGDRLTFAEWSDQALRLARAFADRGVRPGDIVLIGLENSIDFAVCFAAAQVLGAVASGVNTRLGRREVDSIVERSQAALMVMEDDREVPEGATTIVRREELAGLRRNPARLLPPAGRPDDLAVIIWTSGTTGMPKGACFTHDNLRTAIWTAGPLAARFARRLASVPFAHAGFMSKGWEQVAFGMTMVIAPTPWSADAMLRLLVEEKVEIGAGVPTQWAKLLEHPDLPNADLSHVKVGITATAPATPELIERVTRAIGVPLITRYSMTECPSMTGTRIGDSPEVQYPTVGRPQPMVEIKLVDDHGEEVAPGAIGRIAVRSQMAMVGYWRDPERTAEVLTDDGWLVSGDYGRIRDDGNLVLAGRTTEMYIRGGYNVYPIEIERVISEMPEVAAVAVVGKPAPVIGEIGVAFVIPNPGATPPTLAAIQAKVRSELADYKVPEQLVLLDALPLTSVMKVDKQALRRQAAEMPSTRG